MEMNRKSLKTKRKRNQNSEVKKMDLKDLPGEIFELILSKLPFFSFPSCRLVCKSWNNFILTCKFDASKNSNLLCSPIAHPSRKRRILHGLKLNVDDDPHKNKQGFSIVASFVHPFCIINSCNGLLCGNLRSADCRKPDSICILNPMTNECFELTSKHPGRNYSYGFGFSPKMKQYKIVRHTFAGRFLHRVEIFAIGTRTRKSTRVILVPFELMIYVTYFNGALYWFGHHLPPHRPQIVIFRFDLEDETFKETSFIGSSGESFLGILGIFQDTLYLTTKSFEVWKLEQDSYSWIKVFGGPLFENLPNSSRKFVLVKVYEDEKMLFAYGSNIILYDPTIGTSRILKTVVGIESYFYFDQIDSFSFDSLDTIFASDGWRRLLIEELYTYDMFIKS